MKDPDNYELEPKSINRLKRWSCITRFVSMDLVNMDADTGGHFLLR